MSHQISFLFRRNKAAHCHGNWRKYFLRVGDGWMSQACLRIMITSEPIRASVTHATNLWVSLSSLSCFTLFFKLLFFFSSVHIPRGQWRHFTSGEPSRHHLGLAHCLSLSLVVPSSPTYLHLLPDCVCVSLSSCSCSWLFFKHCVWAISLSLFYLPAWTSVFPTAWQQVSALHVSGLLPATVMKSNESQLEMLSEREAPPTLHFFHSFSYYHWRISKYILIQSLNQIPFNAVCVYVH